MNMKSDRPQADEIRRPPPKADKQSGQATFAHECRVQLRNGRLHLGHAVCDQCFSGCVAVATLARDDAWWLLPLHSGAGDLQLKLRNPQGDRVVETQEFFRGQGLEDSPEPRDFSLRLDEQRGVFELVSRST